MMNNSKQEENPNSPDTSHSDYSYPKGGTTEQMVDLVQFQEGKWCCWAMTVHRTQLSKYLRIQWLHV